VAPVQVEPVGEAVEREGHGRDRLELPEPAVLPLARFAEGLELYRRREQLKVVFVP